MSSVRPSRARLVHPDLAARVPAIRSAASAALVIGALTAVCIVVQAVALATAIDRSLLHHVPLSMLRPELIALALAVVARAVLALVGERTAERTAESVVTAMRGQLLRHVLALGPGWLGGERPGELSLTATRGLRSLHTYFSRYLPQAAAAAVIPVILLAWIASQDWLSLVIVLALVLAVPITMIYFGREANRRTARQWRRLGSLAGRFLQLIEGLPTLRAFGRDALRATRSRRVHRRRPRRHHAHLARRLPLRTLDGSDRRIRRRIRGHGLGSAPVVGRARPADGDGRASGHSGDLHPSAPGRGRVPRQHRRASGGGPGRSRSWLSLPTTQPASTQPTSTQPTASPPRQLAASRQSRRGPPWTCASTAFASPMRIAPRPHSRGSPSMCRPEAGWRSSGHREPASRPSWPRSSDSWRRRQDPSPSMARRSCDVPVAQWRTHFSWLPQRPYLFTATLAENLRLGAPEATDELLERVTAAVGLDRLVAHLPLGLATQLGQDGLTLSTGERQRVALARALLRPAPILLLDEPTASLDPPTTARLAHTIAPWLDGRTVIVTAHEPTLLAHFDDVVDCAQRTFARGHAMKAIRRILAEPGTPYGRLALAGLLGLAAAAATIGLLAGSGYILGRAASHPPLSALVGILAAVEVLAFLRGPLRYAERLVGHDAALRALARWRVWLYDCLTPRVPAALSGWRSGDLLASAIDDVDTLQDLYLRTLLPLGIAAGAAIVGIVVVGLELPVAALALGIPLVAGVHAAPVPGLAQRRP